VGRNSPPGDPRGPGGILKVSALGIEEQRVRVTICDGGVRDARVCEVRSRTDAAAFLLPSRAPGSKPRETCFGPHLRRKYPKAYRIMR